MNIKKSKGESVGDPVIDGVITAKKFFEKNGNNILLCCAATLVVVVGAILYGNMRNADVKKAQELFAVGALDYNAGSFEKALESFSAAASNHKGTPSAHMSAFMMGSIYLQLDSVDLAIASFESALSGGGAAGLVRAQSFEGLATAYEAKGDNAAAVRYLERALKDPDGAHRRAAIRWKLALLNKDNPSAVSAYCNDIVSDTSAVSYHQKAQNLKATLNVK